MKIQHTLLHVYVIVSIICKHVRKIQGSLDPISKKFILILGRCSEGVILGWVVGETNRARVGGGPGLRLLRKGRGWVGIFRPVFPPPPHTHTHTHSLIVPAPIRHCMFLHKAVYKRVLCFRASARGPTLMFGLVCMCVCFRI